MARKTASFGKLLILTLMFVLLLSIVDVRAADKNPGRIPALRQAGEQLLNIGKEQYRRGMYESASITLSKAEKYKKYLSVADSSELKVLLSKVKTSQAAQRPVKVKAPVIKPQPQPQPTPSVKPQPQPAPSAKPVQQQSVPQYRQIPVQQQHRQPAQLQQQSLSGPQIVYGPQETEAVNPNYITVPPQTVTGTAVDTNYIKSLPVATSPVAAWQIPQPNSTEYSEIPSGTAKPEVSKVQTPGAAAIEMPVEQLPHQLPKVQPSQTTEQSTKQTQKSYIDVIEQKKRIQQSYTKAVVDNAIAKAKEYASKGDFGRAKDEVSRAAGIVKRNKLLLGDSTYSGYRTSLEQLRNDNAARQQEIEAKRANTARLEAKATQEHLRARQSADRQKRIADLMTHAQEYQQQQRYEEALGQIQTLLAIDPTNEEAARSQQMLEDILNLRRQLAVKKEMGRQEQDLFSDNQSAMIPHADLITYPKNWQDITARRTPQALSGENPADAAVYKQLASIVDLSAMTPDTTFEEAIDIIRKAVNPPLKIIVRWKDLEENAYIQTDTVIGTKGINGIPLGQGLKELLDSISGGIVKIDYVINGGVITIATKASLPSQLVPRPYDITELIGTPANFSADLTAVGNSSGGTSGLGSVNISQSSSGNTSVQLTTTKKLASAEAIVQLIEDTIDPDSWFVNGGEGTISIHGNKLVILQTPQIHKKIYKLLMKDLRESLGQQVSIETRFLFVSENFLEDIGVNMDVRVSAFGKLQGDLNFKQDSYKFTQPSSTLIPGSIGGSLPNGALNMSSVQYGSLLDDLSVTFLLRATQAHKDAKMLTAPRVTVLSGESAYISVIKQTAYVSDYDFQNVSTSGSGNAVQNRTVADPQTDTVNSGVTLNVTPTISADKKYVILYINTNYTRADLTKFNVYSETGVPYPISLPTQEITEVGTRVSVPDNGTLLIGGQKLGAEENKEAGVPGLSKLPIVGRLFSNRSKVKDQNILLILVKPTIILQDESERNYFAPLEK